jgi:uncharacterized repeat protein (TIGR02543 family)
VVGAGAATNGHGVTTRSPVVSSTGSKVSRAGGPTATLPTPAGAVDGLARSAAPSPKAAVTLYNQYNNPAPTPGGVTSQNFDAANDAFDSEAADDFVVPAGVNWTVTTLDVQGEYTAAGPVVDFNVVFYANVGNLPGSVVAARPAQAYTNTSGDFTITFAQAVTLSPGTYWVGVQANMDLANGQWFWDNRTVSSNQGAAWRNANNGFGTGCTGFGRKTTCLGGQNGPDQLFKLSGYTITTPDHTGSLASTDPVLTDPGGRMFRSDPPSTCAAPKPFPGYTPGTGFHYRTHSFRNASATPACVTVRVDPMACTATNFIHVSAYLNAFNPANLAQNYLANIGGSPSVVKEFSFTVPAGAKVVLVVNEATANSGCSGYQLVENAPGAAQTFSQTFDGVAAPTLPAGWTAANAVGPAPLWVASNTGASPAADSAPNGAFVDDPNVRSDKILTGPTLAVRTASAQLVFRHSYALENGFDGGALEVSKDGSAFQDIVAAGGSFEARGYNGTVSPAFQNPLAGRAAWTGSSNGFVTTVVNLPASAAGHSLTFRWRMGSDITVGSTGWRIDSVRLLDGQRLTVSKAGNGSGTVTSNAAGISCGTACSTTFEIGSSVALTATPATGTTFAGWAGSCSGTGTCTVPINAAKSVTATFTLQSRSLTVKKAGNGVGKVTSAPAGVNCPKACLGSFLYGTALTLTATPSKKAVFSGWTGDCAGKSKTCALSMTANHTATAKFTAKCVVPKLKGLTLKKARAKLKKAHCRVGKITKKASTKKKQGRVLKQKSKPGKILKPNAKVNLTVGKGGL